VRQKSQQEDLMIRYLLGDLTEEEQTQIEERFLADKQYFEHLCSVEDALIDDYAQRNLTEYEHRKVEGLLLSSPRQAREIEFVQDIIKYVSNNPIEEIDERDAGQLKPANKSRSLLALPHIRSLGSAVALAVILILIIASVCIVIWNLALQKKIGQLVAMQAGLEERHEELRQQLNKQDDSREAIVKELESERRKREQLEEELSTLQESRPLISTNNIATLNLKTASFTRGEGKLRVVHINPRVTQFQIRINLDKVGDYKSYSAVIKTFEGREIWSKDQIKPGQVNLARLVFTLPADILENHDYILTLKGQTGAESIVEIGDYPFRIKR